MILTPSHLLERICEILEMNEADVRSKKRRVHSQARFLFYYIGFNDFNFYKKTLGEEFGRDHSCAINGINRMAKLIADEDSIAISSIRKIRYELGVSKSLSDTIIEKQYDVLLEEFIKMKRDNKKLQEKVEALKLENKKLRKQCLYHSQ